MTGIIAQGDQVQFPPEFGIHAAGRGKECLAVNDSPGSLGEDHMDDPHEIDERDVAVLEIVARGHPERSFFVDRSDPSQPISGLSWEEIQVASGRTLAEVWDSLARLGGNGLIDNRQLGPGFFGGLFGQDPTTYYWITPKGRAFLQARAP